MARAIGSGTISFGMVSIPVRFYVATHSEQFRFHLIHEQCGSRIRQQLYCPRDQRVVKRSSAKQVELARKLIADLSTDHFDPARYEDRYRERIARLIRQKGKKGERITVVPEKPKETKVIDLMDALKKSLSREGRSARPATRERRHGRARSRRKQRPAA